MSWSRFPSLKACFCFDCKPPIVIPFLGLCPKHVFLATGKKEVKVVSEISSLFCIKPCFFLKLKRVMICYDHIDHVLSNKG